MQEGQLRQATQGVRPHTKPPSLWHPSTRLTSIALVACALGFLATQAKASTIDPEVEGLIEVFRGTGAPGEADAAVYALAAMGERAIPGLTQCLTDPLSKVRLACAEILSLMPPELAGPVLRDAIDGLVVPSVIDVRHTTSSTSRDEHQKAFFIGALGRLKSPGGVPYTETVPYLETLYAQYAEGSTIKRSIAWALQNLTGTQYGPAYDPWFLGR